MDKNFFTYIITKIQKFTKQYGQNNDNLTMTIYLPNHFHIHQIKTRCTRGIRIVFSVTRMRSSNSARMNKFDFTTEIIGSVHMTVFEIVAPHNVDNWIQLLT